MYMRCALQHGQPVQGSAPQQFFIMLLCVVVVVDAVSLRCGPQHGQAL